jgi:hypothetical protein
MTDYVNAEMACGDDIRLNNTIWYDISVTICDEWVICPKGLLYR